MYSGTYFILKGDTMKQALLIIDAQQELIDGNEQENEVFVKPSYYLH